MNYRKKIDVNVIRFPEGFVEEQRTKDCKVLCCDRFLVLADESDTANYKNDITGVYVKLSEATDIVTFVLEKCGTGAVPNLGDIGIFPQDSLADGYIYDWRQILTTYGAGNYTIKIEFTISGVVGGFTYGEFELKPYSIENARGTVRVWSEFNSKYQKDNLDFTSSNFKDSIRFNGFFGNREPKTEINNLISKGRVSEKVIRENLNSYTLRTDPIYIEVSRRLLDFHFLNEDKCLITDHNASNHDYILFDVPVVLEETPEVEYIEMNRYAKIKAVFGDRAKKSKSYYNLQ